MTTVTATAARVQTHSCFATSGMAMATAIAATMAQEEDLADEAARGVGS